MKQNIETVGIDTGPTTACIIQEINQLTILGRLDNNNFRRNVRVTSINWKALHFAKNSIRSKEIAVRIAALRKWIEQGTFV